MNVLVVAASKHGSTREIAEMISERLRSHGLEVLSRNPADVADLDGVDAVVLGSAVYAGRWLAPARDLVQRLGAELAARRVWLFSSGPIGEPLAPAGDAPEAAQMVAATGAVDHHTFAGRLDRSSLGFAERAIVRALKAPEGDFRDWLDVKGWADGIATELEVLAVDGH